MRVSSVVNSCVLVLYFLLLHYSWTIILFTFSASSSNLTSFCCFFPFLHRTRRRAQNSNELPMQQPMLQKIRHSFNLCKHHPCVHLLFLSSEKNGQEFEWRNGTSHSMIWRMVWHEHTNLLNGSSRLNLWQLKLKQVNWSFYSFSFFVSSICSHLLFVLVITSNTLDRPHTFLYHNFHSPSVAIMIRLRTVMVINSLVLSLLFFPWFLTTVCEKGHQDFVFSWIFFPRFVWKENLERILHLLSFRVLSSFPTEKV